MELKSGWGVQGGGRGAPPQRVLQYGVCMRLRERRTSRRTEIKEAEDMGFVSLLVCLVLVVVIFNAHHVPSAHLDCRLSHNRVGRE